MTAGWAGAARGRRSRADGTATVTFSRERAVAGVDEVMAGLDRDLIGLAPVKRRIQEIAALLLVDRARRRFGLTAPRPTLHMCFTGAPGTGKTTVGLRMAELLHRLGYLEKGHLVVAMRDDLVGPYVGQTAHMTKRVLSRARGGVLLIDEAYHLYREDSSRDYGPEAIEILLQVMENERDQLVVILAGYADRMEAFFRSNPGMQSRIAHHLDFADYGVAELQAIGQLMFERSGYYLSPAAEATFAQVLAASQGDPGFANARGVRNTVERARFRHANRLVASAEVPRSRDDLMRIEPEDVQADDPADAVT